MCLHQGLPQGTKAYLKAQALTYRHWRLAKTQAMTQVTNYEGRQKHDTLGCPYSIAAAMVPEMTTQE
ncbi:MAG: hypothetical protein ACI9W2_002845 [Gammaproteobacteria bacterium]|jgi:hypothetical protein